MSFFQSMANYRPCVLRNQHGVFSSKHGNVPKKNQALDMSSLSDRLKEARKDAGLTQQALTQKAGLKRQSIVGAIESGDQKTSSYTPQLAAALGVNALWLATGKGLKHNQDAQVGSPADVEEQVDADMFFRCWRAVSVWLKQAPGERHLTEEQRMHMAANLYDVFHAQQDTTEEQMLLFIKGWVRFRGGKA